MDLKSITVCLTITLYCVVAKNISEQNLTLTPSSDAENVNKDSEDSSTGLNGILNDLEQYKPVEIIKGLSVQVEKTQIPAPSIPTTPLTSVISDVHNHGSRQGRKLASPPVYFTSHALKLDFGLFNLRLGRSVDKPDNLELSVNWADDNENGRSKKDKHSKMLLPIMLGIKLAGALGIMFLTVSLLSVKALMTSKLALALAGIILIKKLFSKTPWKPAPVASPIQVEPYVMPNYHLNLPDAGAYQNNDFDAAAYSNSNYGLSGPDASNSDLSPQYVTSEHQGILEVAPPNNTLAAVAAAAKRRDSSRFRPYVAKYHPVYNYRKTLKP